MASNAKYKVNAELRKHFPDFEKTKAHITRAEKQGEEIQRKVGGLKRRSRA